MNSTLKTKLALVAALFTLGACMTTKTGQSSQVASAASDALIPVLCDTVSSDVDGGSDSDESNKDTCISDATDAHITSKAAAVQFICVANVGKYNEDYSNVDGSSKEGKALKKKLTADCKDAAKPARKSKHLPLSKATSKLCAFVAYNNDAATDSDESNDETCLDDAANVTSVSDLIGTICPKADKYTTGEEDSKKYQDDCRAEGAKY